MATLEIGNSYSRLSDLSVDDYKTLRDRMSYVTDPTAVYRGGRVHKKCLLSKRLEFPSGLIYIVEELLYGNLQVIDRRVCPITRLGAHGTLFQPGAAPKAYPPQLEAPKALIRVGEGRGIISAPTGSGKSRIMAEAIDLLKVRTLIVTPSLELKRQLTDNLISWFGKDTFNSLCQVSNVDSLNPSKPAVGFGALFLDEYHRAASKSYQDLNKKAWGDIYYRAGFTATPYRTHDNEQLPFQSILSKVVYEITYQDAVDNGYIVPLQAYSLDIPKTPIKGNKASYPAMYSELIVNNEVRNNRIAIALGRLHSQGVSTLCLVREIRHGEILSEKTYFPFANGQDGQSEELIRAFNSGEIKTLIGTVGVVGEGVDTRPCEYVVLAGAGKSPIQFAQNIGRGFRRYPGKESCKVILIGNSDHKWFKAHYSEQVKILRDTYGVEPVIIDL